MITSPTTVGVECRPISPFSRSICLSLPMTTPDLQVDDAALAERLAIGWPVFAFSATRR